MTRNAETVRFGIKRNSMYELNAVSPFGDAAEALAYERWRADMAALSPRFVDKGIPKAPDIELPPLEEPVAIIEL